MSSSSERRQTRAMDTEITVVIPTLGRPILKQSLAALVDCDPLPGRIIVVDQSSSPKIGDLLGPAAAIGIETTHLCSNERGRSAGLNRGLELVRSRFVAVTDDDCLADPGWVSHLGKHLQQYPQRVFTGRVTTAGDEPVLGTVLGSEDSIADKPGLVFDKLSGGNLGMSMEVLQRVGLFDEDPCLRYSEDGEWAYRALRRKTEIAFVSDLIVCHVGWRNEEERLEQYLGYAHSHAAFFGKYLRKGDAFMILRASIHLARSIKRWLSGAVRGDAEIAANGRSYTMQFLPGLLTGFRSRIRAPRLRVIGARKIDQ